MFKLIVIAMVLALLSGCAVTAKQQEVLDMQTEQKRINRIAGKQEVCLYSTFVLPTPLFIYMKHTPTGCTFSVLTEECTCPVKE